MSSGRERQARFDREQREAHEATYKRIKEVWQVPQKAAESFVELEDAVGQPAAVAIANFVTAMINCSAED